MRITSQSNGQGRILSALFIKPARMKSDKIQIKKWKQVKIICAQIFGGILKEIGDDSDCEHEGEGEDTNDNGFRKYS